MKKGDVLGCGEAARILRGRLAGLVGVVEEIDMEGGCARLHISGVVEDEPIDQHVWYALANLGRNHGKN